MTWNAGVTLALVGDALRYSATSVITIATVYVTCAGVHPRHLVSVPRHSLTAPGETALPDDFLTISALHLGDTLLIPSCQLCAKPLKYSELIKVNVKAARQGTADRQQRGVLSVGNGDSTPAYWDYSFTRYTDIYMQHQLKELMQSNAAALQWILLLQSYNFSVFR